MTDTQPAPTTTDAGIPIESDEHSLTIGPDGPILLHDHYLIEQLAQFNRERVPERQPHAKGSGAFGRLDSLSQNEIDAVTAVPPTAGFQERDLAGIHRRVPRAAGHHIWDRER